MQDSGYTPNSRVFPMRATFTRFVLIAFAAADFVPALSASFFARAALASARFLALASFSALAFSILSRSRRAASALRSSFCRSFSSAFARSRSCFASIAASSRARFRSSAVGVFVRENLPWPSYSYSVPLSWQRMRSPTCIFFTERTTLVNSAVRMVTASSRPSNTTSTFAADSCTFWTVPSVPLPALTLSPSASCSGFGGDAYVGSPAMDAL